MGSASRCIVTRGAVGSSAKLCLDAAGTLCVGWDVDDQDNPNFDEDDELDEDDEPDKGIINIF
jgi:hypothetical protein